MRFVAIGCLCAGALVALGCTDNDSVPTGPSPVAAVPGSAPTGSAPSVPANAGTATQAVLLLTKTCDAIDHCTVITSSSGPIPAGSDINYFGPLLEVRTTSRIRVTTPAGDTADGTCSVSNKTGVGTCLITGGTGALAGLHANLQVSSNFSDPAHPEGVFTWEGRYHFEP